MEAQLGKPFVGGAGVLLNLMLDKARIPRDECFVTNVCHKQPPGNKFEWFFTQAGMPTLIAGIAQLKRDIEEIRPNLIVTLGAYPTQIITSQKGITKWRGSLLPSTLTKGFKVLPSFHPAYCLRVYEAGAILGLDLMRAAAHRGDRKLAYPKRHIFIPGGKVIFRDGAEWVTESVSDSTIAEEAARMLKAPVLSIDIECWQREDGSWKLACVGFGDRPDRALVLTPDHMPLIRALCASNARKVYQNGQFDVTVLRDNGVECTNFWWDTMVGHHVLFAEASSGSDEMSLMQGKKKLSVFQKGLAFQTSIYTEEPFYKDDGKLWKQDGDIDKFYRYNGLDVCVTLEIQQAQEVDLNTRGLMWPFMESMRQMPVFMAAMWRGIRINTTARSEMAAKYTAEAEALQRTLDTLAGSPVNVKSSPQVQALLYDKFKLPTQLKRGSRRPTADKDAIHALAGKHSHPVLSTILGIRERRDMLERYLASPIDSDGRIRCSVDATGTRSYRLASRASIYGSGTNLQNQPDEIRRMFIPDEGCIFLYPDFSQAEARVVAYQARCAGLIELFNDPSRDVHKENASRIFGKPIAQITKAERYLAKRVVHAANYGMLANRLAAVVNEDADTTGVRITTHEAEDLLFRYFLLYPEIKEVFWRGVERDLKRDRTLVNPFGFQRTFYGRYDESMIREAYSWVPQSTVGIIGRIAWANTMDLESRYPELGLMTLMQVHDSILSQVRISKLDAAAALCLTAMEIPCVLNGYSFKIPVDMSVGMNWCHASESNPDGLMSLKEWKESHPA